MTERTFHKVKTLDGDEVQVIDEEHVRIVLFKILKWVGTVLLGYLVAVALWAWSVSDTQRDMKRDIAELKLSRVNDSTAALNIYELRRVLDTLGLNVRFLNNTMIDLSEDVKALRRELKIPR